MDIPFKAVVQDMPNMIEQGKKVRGPSCISSVNLLIAPQYSIGKKSCQSRLKAAESNLCQSISSRTYRSRDVTYTTYVSPTLFCNVNQELTYTHYL